MPGIDAQGTKKSQLVTESGSNRRLVRNKNGVGEIWEMARKAWQASDNDEERDAAATAHMPQNELTYLHLIRSQFAREFIFSIVQFTEFRETLVLSRWNSLLATPIGSSVNLLCQCLSGTSVGSHLNQQVVTCELAAVFDSTFKESFDSCTINPMDTDYEQEYFNYVTKLQHALANYCDLKESLPPNSRSIILGIGKFLKRQVEDSSLGSDPAPLPLFCPTLANRLVQDLSPFGPVFEYFATITEPSLEAYGPSSHAQWTVRLVDFSESVIRTLVRTASISTSDPILCACIISLCHDSFTPIVDIFALPRIAAFDKALGNVPYGFSETLIDVCKETKGRYIRWETQKSDNPSCTFVARQLLHVVDKQELLALSAEALVWKRRPYNKELLRFPEIQKARDDFSNIPSTWSSEMGPIRFIDFILPPAESVDLATERRVAALWSPTERNMAAMAPEVNQQINQLLSADLRYEMILVWKRLLSGFRTLAGKAIAAKLKSTEGTEGVIPENPDDDNLYLEETHLKLYKRIHAMRQLELERSDDLGEGGSKPIDAGERATGSKDSATGRLAMPRALNSDTSKISPTTIEAPVPIARASGKTPPSTSSKESTTTPPSNTTPHKRPAEGDTAFGSSKRPKTDALTRAKES